ncbi:MAG TPA: hypothetical protein VGC70_11100 [Burkholderiales bacterium]
MNERMGIELGATLVDRINSLRMTEAERQVALDAMRNARLLVDAWLWLVGKIGQLSGASGALEPSSQH